MSLQDVIQELQQIVAELGTLNTKTDVVLDKANNVLDKTDPILDKANSALDTSTSVLSSLKKIEKILIIGLFILLGLAGIVVIVYVISKYLTVKQYTKGGYIEMAKN